MTRIALGIEYDGTEYVGWQRQNSGVGVQQRLEEAIATVANEDVKVICAGRTDTGVHAVGQVAHFDSNVDRSMRGWLLGINSNLPDDINVTFATSADSEFHARFSAESRTYHYLILNRLVRSSLFRRRAWWIHEQLDEDSMHLAAQHLLGEHDFSAFRAAGCHASTPIRDINGISVERSDFWLRLSVTANAFLQHMVRNIVGTLVCVGTGEQKVEWVKEILASRDRTASGVAAPPHGLTFMSVRYPDGTGVPPANADSPVIKVYDSRL